MEWFVALQEADKAYPPEYFAAQICKSDAKIAWQYGRIFELAGVRDVDQLRVIDVGCGAGPGLRYLAGRGALVLGLDHSRYALKTALALSPAAGVALNDSATRAAMRVAERRSGAAERAGRAYRKGSARCMRNAIACCGPAAMIVVTTPNLWDARRVLSPLIGRKWSGDIDSTHVNLYTPTRLAAELRRAGFGQVRWHTGVKPAWWLSSRRLRLRLPILYPPLIGNGLLATGVRIDRNA